VRETVGRAWQIESTHLPFALASRLMGSFDSIVGRMVKKSELID
jgi:hypothetical protein